jgi:sec-independent protein translocase protein TatB
MAQNVTNDLKENLGPGYEDLQVKDLHPKALIKKHIGDVIDKSELEGKPKPKIDPEIL